MSWKSLVTAGLLCVVASPAFAVGPTLGVVASGTASNGHLNASGQWAWTAQVSADQTNITGGTPLAVELGFTSSSTGVAAGQGGLVSVANATPATFDAANAGTTIFGWEQNYTPSGGTSKPEGLEVNCTGCTVTPFTANYPTTGAHPTTLVVGTTNQIFAALGSANITVGTPQNLLNIVVQKPVVTLANSTTTSRIVVSGAYSGKGRIAQFDPTAPTTTKNYDTFGGTGYTFTQTARGGDVDLNGANDFNDFQTLFNNYLGTGKNWSTGDFTGEGTTDFNDFQILFNNYLAANYTVGPVASGAGAGLGAGGAVPEPASIAMLGLALLGGLGIIRRR